MNSLIIKYCLIYIVFLYSLAYAASISAANNSIYITQSGGSSALTMNIDQIGNSNVVGTISGESVVDRHEHGRRRRSGG
jgi:hypothetical protein